MSKLHILHKNNYIDYSNGGGKSQYLTCSTSAILLLNKGDVAYDC